jgi:ubiquinone/menaquinone biosynthesis C-methylase UbiE
MESSGETMQMSSTTGFENVDTSGRSEELVDYLMFFADLVADNRRQGLEMLNLQAGAAVLDVGCGAGELCVDLARRVGPRGRVVGIDASETMIHKARETAASSGQDVEFHVASVYRLPFADQTFDVVRAERLFQHLDNPQSALAEMVRVTRTGSQIMLVDFEHGQWSMSLDDPLDWKVFEVLRRALLRKVINPHSGVRLRGMMQRIGLTDVKHLTTTLELTYPDLWRAIRLGEILAASVNDGSITREDVDAFAASLQARHRAGIFLANMVGYSAIGRRIE